MAERETLVEGKKITYEGLFNAKELFRITKSFFTERNYDWDETKNFETVKPDGRHIEIVIEPYKKETDYFNNVIVVRLIISNLTDVEIEQDKVKKKMQSGKVQIILDAILETDHETRWESKPIFFFLRTLVNKYVMEPYTKQYRGSCAADLNAYVAHIKGYLNLYRE